MCTNICIRYICLMGAAALLHRIHCLSAARLPAHTKHTNITNISNRVTDRHHQKRPRSRASALPQSVRVLCHDNNDDNGDDNGDDGATSWNIYAIEPSARRMVYTIYTMCMLYVRLYGHDDDVHTLSNLTKSLNADVHFCISDNCVTT